MSSSSSNPYDFPVEREIVKKIQLLDVCFEDFAGCDSVDDEFMVILRKSDDRIASYQSTEPGYAQRIREIRGAHRNLQEWYEDGVIESFSEFLLQPPRKGSTGTEENNHDDGESDSN